jgi:hypothetical protein
MMITGSGLFAASVWSWLWTALVIERASAVAWAPLMRWVSTHRRGLGPLWALAAQRAVDIALAALCILYLETPPPLSGLIGLQPSGVSTGLSALVMAGFIDLWRRVLSMSAQSVSRPSGPAFKLSTATADQIQDPSQLTQPIPKRQGFQLGSLSLHRSES